MIAFHSLAPSRSVTRLTPPPRSEAGELAGWGSPSSLSCWTFSCTVATSASSPCEDYPHSHMITPSTDVAPVELALELRAGGREPGPASRHRLFSLTAPAEAFPAGLAELVPRLDDGEGGEVEGWASPEIRVLARHTASGFETVVHQACLLRPEDADHESTCTEDQFSPGMGKELHNFLPNIDSVWQPFDCSDNTTCPKRIESFAFFSPESGVSVGMGYHAAFNSGVLCDYDFLLLLNLRAFEELTLKREEPWWPVPEQEKGEYSSLTVKQLKAELKQCGLPTSGVKAVLAARLEEAAAEASPAPFPPKGVSQGRKRTSSGAAKAAPDPLTALPPELLAIVLAFLGPSPYTLHALSVLNKSASAACSDPLVASLAVPRELSLVRRAAPAGQRAHDLIRSLRPYANACEESPTSLDNWSFSCLLTLPDDDAVYDVRLGCDDTREGPAPKLVSVDALPGAVVDAIGGEEDGGDAVTFNLRTLCHATNQVIQMSRQVDTLGGSEYSGGEYIDASHPFLYVHGPDPRFGSDEVASEIVFEEGRAQRIEFVFQNTEGGNCSRPCCADDRYLTRLLQTIAFSKHCNHVDTGSVAPEAEAAAYAGLTVKLLKGKLAERGLSTSGAKGVLVARLEEDDDASDDDVSE